MLHGETLAALAEWEQTFPVSDWRWGSVHVWPFLRTYLGSRILTAGRPPQPPRTLRQRPPVRFVEESARALWAGARDRSNAPAIGPAEVVLLGRPSSRQPVDGRWYDSLLDPLADALEADGRSLLMLEYRSTMLRYRVPRHRPTVVTRPALSPRRLLAHRRDLRRPPPLALERYDDFVRTVAERYPTVAVPSRFWLARRMRDIDASATYFDGLFAEARPRLALFTPYYNAVGLGFCLAAARAGVCSVDVQHGVVRGNPAYDRWTAFPSGGYALVPDRVWCWSELDADPIDGWGTSAHRAIVGGHPWHAYWDRRGATQEDLESLPRGERTVLVSLTWSSGWSEALRELVAAAPSSWAFWIRLHPLMHTERPAVVAWCARQRGAALEVEAATDLPLPLLLQHADVHLTHNSSVVQEAAAVAKPSVVIDDRALDVYTQEIASGIAVHAASTAEAIDALRGAAGGRADGASGSWAHLRGTLTDLLDDAC